LSLGQYMGCWYPIFHVRSYIYFSFWPTWTRAHVMSFTPR
jgi:hypothetical protein